MGEQPRQLCACWSASARYLEVGEWRSLVWGALPLRQLTETLHAPGRKRGPLNLLEQTLWALQALPSYHP